MWPANPGKMGRPKLTWVNCRQVIQNSIWQRCGAFLPIRDGSYGVPPVAGLKMFRIVFRGCRCQAEMTSYINVWWCMTMYDYVWLYIYIYSYRLIDMVYSSLLYTLSSVMPLWFHIKHHSTLAKVFRRLGLLCLFKVIRWEFHSWKTIQIYS